MNENATNNDWLQAVSDRPLLVSPAHIQQFLAGANALLTFVAGGMLRAGSDDSDNESSLLAVDDGDFWADGWRARYYRPYNVSDGLLTIPIRGALIDKMGLQFGGFATGYTYIQKAFERGMSDAAVQGILLEVDSTGGQGEGNFELVEYMNEIKGSKPVHAVANGAALSGAYSIASVADSLTVRKSGSTGSVGVISVHIDVSEMLAKDGIKPTVIRSGKYKAEGNGLEPLSTHARDSIQATSDRFYDTFVKTVAINRGISEDSVRETEAQVYGADDSVAIGFADRIGEVRHQRSRMLEPGSEGMQMADEANGNNGSQGGSESGPTITETDVATARSEAQANERQRFAAVMASDEYTGREELAGKMLADTDMAADGIIAMLKVAPKAADAGGENNGESRNHFNETMDREGGAGATGGEPPADTADHALWPGRPEGAVSILESYRRSGGRVNDDIKRNQHG